MKPVDLRLLKSEIQSPRQGQERRLCRCGLAWLVVAVLVAGGCGGFDGSFDAAASSDAWITEDQFIQTQAGREALAQLRATFADYPVQDMYYQRLHVYRHKTTGDPTIQVLAYHATLEEDRAGELLYRFKYCIRVTNGLVTYSREKPVYEFVKAVE